MCVRFYCPVELTNYTPHPPTHALLPIPHTSHTPHSNLTYISPLPSRAVLPLPATPTHPHTLTPSHPRTLTPSHPHTHTPSHPRTHAPSHLHILTPSHTVHTLHAAYTTDPFLLHFLPVTSSFTFNSEHLLHCFSDIRVLVFSHF